MCKKARLMFAT